MYKRQGFITLVVSGIACIGSLVWFMRSKTLDKLALKKDITSKVDRSAANKVKVGDTGITTTRLAQIGYADIAGNIIEVKSMDGLLDEKTPIVVNRITAVSYTHLDVYKRQPQIPPYSFSTMRMKKIGHCVIPSISNNTMCPTLSQWSVDIA